MSIGIKTHRLQVIILETIPELAAMQPENALRIPCFRGFNYRHDWTLLMLVFWLEFVVVYRFPVSAFLMNYAPYLDISFTRVIGDKLRAIDIAPPFVRLGPVSMTMAQQMLPPDIFTQLMETTKGPVPVVRLKGLDFTKPEETTTCPDSNDSFLQQFALDY